MRAALDSTEVQSKLIAMGATLLQGQTPETMATLIRDENAKWGKLIKDLKLQLD